MSGAKSFVNRQEPQGKQTQRDLGAISFIGWQLSSGAWSAGTGSPQVDPPGPELGKMRERKENFRSVEAF